MALTAEQASPHSTTYMKLHLNRPIIFFDIEATGLNIVTDRIVELCYIKLFPNGEEKVVTQRFNPTIPISAEATAVNGITNADVADKPTFKERAAQLAHEFEGCDFAGYNSNHFDIPLLVEEFIRAGVNFDIHRCRQIDVQGIFHKMEKRDLTAAYKFYCQKDLQNNVAWLADFSRHTRNVDLAGRIVYNDQGVETINFGKYRGKAVTEVLRRDPGYFAWVMQADFTQNTKQTFMRLKLAAGI